MSKRNNKLCCRYAERLSSEEHRNQYARRIRSKLVHPRPNELKVRKPAIIELSETRMAENKTRSGDPLV